MLEPFDKLMTIHEALDFIRSRELGYSYYLHVSIRVYKEDDDAQGEMSSAIVVSKTWLEHALTSDPQPFTHIYVSQGHMSCFFGGFCAPSLRQFSSPSTHISAKDLL